MEPEPEEEGQRSLTGEALELGAAAGGATGGVLVGLAAAHVLDPAGAVVIGAAMAEVLQHFAGRALGLRRRQTAEMFEIAAREADRTVEELLAQLTADPRRLQLAAAAIAVAADTALQAKIRALGRALASGALADDDAKVDQQWVLVDTLRDLEAPHIRVLNFLLRNPAGPTQVTGWAHHELADQLPGVAPVLQPVLRVLAGDALITESRDNFWSITEFGEHCLALLEEEGRENA